MRLSAPWRLSLLFLISGAATSFMLQHDGASAGLLGSRSKRLLWPLLFGMAVIVPPQSYFEVVQQHGYTGSFIDFMRLYASGYGGFCKSQGHCLILPTWNHLWFVAYLFVYTAALWLLLRAWPRAIDSVAAVLARALRGATALWLPIVVLALLRLLLIDRFPPTHALVATGICMRPTSLCSSSAPRGRVAAPPGSAAPSCAGRRSWWPSSRGP